MKWTGVAMVVAALAVGVAAPATAERFAEQATTLGSQAAQADLVALGTPGVLESSEGATAESIGSEVRVRFRVTEVLSGVGVTKGDEIVILHRELGHGRPWEAGRPHLVFLRRTPAAPDGGSADAAETAYAPLAGPLSWRAIAQAAPSARLPQLVRELLATRTGEDGAEDTSALAGVLVRMTMDADAGIAWSGAIDLVHRPDVRATLSDEQRLQVLSAFRNRSAPGRARQALALALGHVGHPEAAPTLIDALAAPDARPDRHAIAEALRILDDPRTAELAVRRLHGADVVQRRNLVNAIGTFGGRAALPIARGALADADPTVRVEAAHALGLVARTVHRESPGEAIEGREALLAVVASAEIQDERRSALWCLAQLDDPRAFAALRRLVDQSPNADVRRFARRYLEYPRSALFLDAR